MKLKDWQSVNKSIPLENTDNLSNRAAFCKFPKNIGFKKFVFYYLNFIYAFIAYYKDLKYFE